MSSSSAFHVRPVQDEGVKTVAFVVLHYLSYELTSKCVESILALDVHSRAFKPAIVIIDNASSNGSVERLRESYGDHPRIAIIENDSNQGFSKANNRAFQYAVAAYVPKHVVVLNNDTVIEQADFLDHLDAVYEREGRPYILGPDIYVRRKGVHQSPMMERMRTRAEVESALDGLLSARGRAGIGSIKRGLRIFLERSSSGRKVLEMRRLLKRREPNWETPARDCVLHGAAVIFTQAFVSLGVDPFHPETFLYEEEQILAVRCKRNGWDYLYTPELQVIHFDDGSTDILTNSEAERKAAFLRKHEISSHEVLLDYMSEFEND